MVSVRCPECDAEIRVPDDAIDGEIVTCPDCGASYEVTRSEAGINLKPAQIVGEDWGE